MGLATPKRLLILWFGLTASFLPESGRAVEESGHIYLTVSVDWEGRDLDDENLRAISRFRRQFESVPLIHFLNAAYFTRPGQNPAVSAKKIASALRPGDEVGLHVHSWKSLVEASGVSYRHYPKWTPPIYHESQVLACNYADCGHEVPLWAYDPEEIRQIIRFSRSVLSEFGFGNAVSFRAGGWMSDSNVLRALALEGFRFDSSAVPAELFGSQLDGYAIPSWVRKLWPLADPVSQPYILNIGQLRMVEMPDNGCLSDYMTSNAMTEVFKKNLDLWRRDTRKDVYIHFGFHQETAQFYLKRLEAALTAILHQAKNEQLPLLFTTFDRISM